MLTNIDETGWMIEVDCLQHTSPATKTMLDINQIEPLRTGVETSLNVGISNNNQIPLLGRVVE